MAFFEMELADGETVMVNFDKISEIEEGVERARVHMVSGNSYLVKMDSLVAAFTNTETPYYKMTQEVVEEI